MANGIKVLLGRTVILWWRIILYAYTGRQVIFYMIADVSVIIPYFNALATIGRSIESVIAQTVAVRELVIVDDASGDPEALARLVDGYRGSLNILLISLEINRGPSNARNVGVVNASSSYIAFLDADDVWHPEKIRIQYMYMQQNPVRLTAHGYIADLQQRPFFIDKHLSGENIGRRSFIYRNPIFTPTVMARREGFCLFDDRYRRMEDYLCWYDNLKNGNHILLSLELAGGFKAAIGSSGLTASVRLMHESCLDVLRGLRKERKMPLSDYLFAYLFEMIKFPVRSFLVFIRKSFS
ncbi:glycosyltransferase family 2 protein [Metapseudomonas otitidis]|uniref:glycosyltransferase family 2 protein n=1 Tax=Metapseudomonas otitidis TaxID=319939 RepID=UPI0039FD9C36